MYTNSSSAPPLLWERGLGGEAPQQNEGVHQPPNRSRLLPRQLLFICSQNRWRSLTAERLFDGHAHYEARSAGTESGARVRVTAGHLGWADVVFVMERRHADILR